MDSIAKYLNENHGEIYALYAFGSFISDKQPADVDIAALIDQVVHDPFSYESAMENELEVFVHKSIDMRILNRAPLSFCYTVIQTGKVMLDKNPNRRSDFESLVIRQYLDFKHFQRRYLSEVADAPV